MIAHLGNPWILARLVLGAVTAALATLAAVGAVSVLWQYRTDANADERTLRLERRSELVGVALSVAFAMEIVAALLTVLASDRLAGSIRGAMCAYGVFGSTPTGALALRASLAASTACAAWLATRRVDVQLRRGSLVRWLSAMALGVTALIYVDLYAAVRYLFALDLDVVATCCSVFVDGARGAAEADTIAHGRHLELARAGGVAAVALVASLVLARRASIARAVSVVLLNGVGSWIALHALIDVVAPYVYEAPQHRCPYCLLHREAAPFGPAMLAALFGVFFTGVATFAVMLHLGRPGARHAAATTLRSIGRWSVWAWGVLVVAASEPLLHYRLVSGTFDLFR